MIVRNLFQFIQFCCVIFWCLIRALYYHLILKAKAFGKSVYWSVDMTVQCFRGFCGGLISMKFGCLRQDGPSDH